MTAFGAPWRRPPAPLWHTLRNTLPSISIMSACVLHYNHWHVNCCLHAGGTSPLPPECIAHPRINKGNNSMNKGNCAVREVKRQAKHTFSRRAVDLFFVFFVSSTLLKCLLNICEVKVEAITEHLILQTVHTRDSKRAGIKKRHYGMAHFGILTPRLYTRTVPRGMKCKKNTMTWFNGKSCLMTHTEVH